MGDPTLLTSYLGERKEGGILLAAKRQEVHNSEMMNLLSQLLHCVNMLGVSD